MTRRATCEREGGEPLVEESHLFDSERAQPELLSLQLSGRDAPLERVYPDGFEGHSRIRRQRWTQYLGDNLPRMLPCPAKAGLGHAQNSARDLTPEIPANLGMLRPVNASSSAY